MAAVKLTKTLVEKTPSAARDVILWDAEVKGFGLKITPQGRRAYFCYYRTRDGVQRRPAIGVHGQITVQAARDIARGWLAEARAGGDPSRERRQAPTMAELCKRFLTEHAVRRNKPGTAYNYDRMIERFVLPALGHRKVADIARADVERLHHELSATPYQANRVLGLVSKMMNLAERWGLRPDGSNPVRHVDKNREAKRERYLSPEETLKLGAVLVEAEGDGSELPSVIGAIRLLVFTGCRMGEILALRWEHVDFGRNQLRLPDSKTGAKVVYLNTAARDVLAALPHDPAGWVVPGGKPGAHLVNLEKPWRRLRARAGLDDVRLHDLRHSFASVAAGLGEGLHMIGKLLGHSQAQTTHRYAHLAADPIKAASQRVSDAIAALMRDARGLQP
jgi:integrase